MCVYTNESLSHDPVIQFTATGTVKLPEGQYQRLQNKVQTEHFQKRNLERDLQVIQRQIIELTDIEKLHQQNFDALTDKIYGLQNERTI
jgi:hypothetical protein